MSDYSNAKTEDAKTGHLLVAAAGGTVTKIKKVAGETRYCNCENTECSEGHGDHPCLENARVILTTNIGPVQLCAECYTFARGGH